MPGHIEAVSAGGLRPISAAVAAQLCSAAQAGRGVIDVHTDLGHYVAATLAGAGGAALERVDVQQDHKQIAVRRRCVCAWVFAQRNEQVSQSNTRLSFKQEYSAQAARKCSLSESCPTVRHRWDTPNTGAPLGRG